MADYLVAEAIQDVWCTPAQDRQSRFSLGKITQNGGVYTKVDVMWRQYALPLAAVLFHVYQVGNVSPSQLGLTIPAVPGLWIKLSEACGKESSIVDLYNINGVQHPRSLAWYTVTDDDALIIAVQRLDKLDINYNDEELFMRTYHNAYFNTQRRDNAVDFIEVKGGVMQSNDQILDMQNKYEVAAARGHTYCFVNGYLVEKINMLTVVLGDVVEFVYDGSIYAVEDQIVGGLGVFDSTLDRKRKYLLHPSQALKTNITYQDDIDVFVMKKNPNGSFKGLYFIRNQDDSVRQVTHADFAICIPYMDAYAGQQNWDDLNQVTIRVHLRKSGYRRSLVNEANRIKELYKLPDVEILNAMIGVQANVPEWKAAALENSDYTRVMHALIKEITPAMVQSMFGYNSMSQYLAPTPQFTQNVSGEALVNIPLNLQYRSTVYEFDFDGKLLGFYPHVMGSLWRAQNSDTHLVQIITGYPVTALDEKYGQAGATLDANLDYRMYTCGMYGGQPDNNWKDVTDTAAYVIASGAGGLTWVVSPHTTYTMVRSNRDFLGYDKDLPFTGGVLRFGLTSDQDRGTGAAEPTLMQVSMGELDLWLNGWALVEGVDYIVNFPEVVIINKKFILPNYDTQRVTVRFCGHCKSDMTRAVIGDRGFISHGVLSNNNRYDIREDKVLHIAIGGAVYDRSELSFAETHNGANVPGAVNGSPYVVRDIVVPMRGTTNAKTYELRDKALITDQHVSDYLTMKLPPPVFTELSPIPELYPVYSPFVSALLDDLKYGVLEDDRMLGQYNDDIVRDICRFYEPLLAFEPTREPNKVDLAYVSVQPYYANTVVDLPLTQYRFLARAVSLYLNNAVSLSHFVTAVA